MEFKDYKRREKITADNTDRHVQEELILGGKFYYRRNVRQKTRSWERKDKSRDLVGVQ